MNVIFRLPLDKKVYNLIFQGFTSDDIFQIEKNIVTFCGYHSHKPKYIRNRRAEYYFSSTEGDEKLIKNLGEMSELIGINIKISYSAGKYFIRKISKRNKKYNWTK